MKKNMTKEDIRRTNNLNNILFESKWLIPIIKIKFRSSKLVWNWN